VYRRVEKLLQDLCTESGVWLAGQRNVDDTWRHMNGTVFSKLGRFVNIYVFVQKEGCLVYSKGGFYW